VVSFVIWYFTTFFIEFAISNYGFKFE
jgi:hypothetical protein